MILTGAERNRFAAALYSDRSGRKNPGKRQDRGLYDLQAVDGYDAVDPQAFIWRGQRLLRRRRLAPADSDIVTRLRKRAVPRHPRQYRLINGVGVGSFAYKMPLASSCAWSSRTAFRVSAQQDLPVGARFRSAAARRTHAKAWEIATHIAEEAAPGLPCRVPRSDHGAIDRGPTDGIPYTVDGAHRHPGHRGTPRGIPSFVKNRKPSSPGG